MLGLISATVSRCTSGDSCGQATGAVGAGATKPGSWMPQSLRSCVVGSASSPCEGDRAARLQPSGSTPGGGRLAGEHREAADAPSTLPTMASQGQACSSEMGGDGQGECGDREAGPGQGAHTLDLEDGKMLPMAAQYWGPSQKQELRRGSEGKWCIWGVIMDLQPWISCLLRALLHCGCRDCEMAWQMHSPCKCISVPVLLGLPAPEGFRAPPL